MIEVMQLQKHFPVKGTLFQVILNGIRGKKESVKAVNGISFTLQRKEIMGLAGESGSGKTTTAMLLLRLYTPTYGSIFFEGKDITSLQGKDLAYFRRNAQLVFQDPYESLNPRFTVHRVIEEPLIINKVTRKKERRKRVLQVMEKVKLTPIEAFWDKYPHEMSGGERQRVCIARAIVLEPLLLVADEATSMLDVSIRASILNLLRELTEDLQMATLYISHDLSLLGSICDKIGIMYSGEIVEMGKPEDIINHCLHPYTKALISAVPIPEFHERKPKFTTISGEPPNLIYLPEGCYFRPRCDNRGEVCLRKKTQLCEVKDGHFVSCHSVRP